MIQREGSRALAGPSRGSPEASRSWEKQGNGSFLGASRRSPDLLTPRFQPSETRFSLPTSRAVEH